MAIVQVMFFFFQVFSSSYHGFFLMVIREADNLLVDLDRRIIFSLFVQTQAVSATPRVIDSLIG